MKCAKNHKYFPKPVNPKEDVKCFLCNKSKVFPYYECKYCKEQICSECSDGVTGKQNTCHNCNNELVWKKCLYTQCERCQKLSECFYFCICCDYAVCLNCSNNPKNKCGALHDLEKIEFDLDNPEKSLHGILYCINKDKQPVTIIFVDKNTALKILNKLHRHDKWIDFFKIYGNVKEGPKSVPVKSIANMNEFIDNNRVSKYIGYFKTDNE